ncbi:MAG: radical SAM protein [Candidatus Omnitrophota bacterium]|nr:radical SAM protein [Candidatus Omnitrophota bacterium]
MDKVVPYLNPVDNNDYVITWLLGTLCNFKCDYCFNARSSASDQAAAYKKYSVKHIAQAFDDTGKIWKIKLTGGEPFLYPRFIEMCGLLAKKHLIAVNTNVSTTNIYEFAESIDPLRVYAFRASWHLLEREKTENGTKLFIGRILHLQKKGFPVRVDYVTYPPFFSRIKKDIQFLKEGGVERIYVKVFRGKFEGKMYPDSYSIQERSLIEELAIDQHELDILSQNYSFMGKKCSAGQRFFAMDEEGNLFRCTSALFPTRLRKKIHGNIFNGNYFFAQEPTHCTYEACSCPYEGLDFIVKERRK